MTNKDITSIKPYLKPKSHCSCGHTGDGPKSEHAGEGIEGPGGHISAAGHGQCLVDGCSCGKFTWAGFTPAYRKYRKTLS